MAKRWSAGISETSDSCSNRCSVQAIAEKMDRSVGGVAFKAYQLGLPLKARSQATDPEPADFNRERLTSIKPGATKFDCLNPIRSS